MHKFQRLIIISFAFLAFLLAIAISEKSIDSIERQKNAVVEGTTGGMLQEVIWNDAVFRKNLQGYLENSAAGIATSQTALEIKNRLGALDVYFIKNDGTIVSSASKEQDGRKLSPHFQCYDVVNGLVKSHLFGVEREVHCEPNIFGISFRRDAKTTVRLMFDLKKLEKFLNREKLSSLLKDISAYQDIPGLELVGADGQVIASFQKPGFTGEGLEKKTFQIKLKGLSLLNLVAYTDPGPLARLKWQNRVVLMAILIIFLITSHLLEKYFRLRSYANVLESDYSKLVEFSRGAIEALPDPAVMLEAGTKCRPLNQKGAEFLGTASGERPMTLEEVKVFRDCPELLDFMKDPRGRKNFDFIVRTAGSVFRLYRCEYVGVGDGAFLVFVDTSGEKIRQIEAEKNVEYSMATLLSAKIAHELRNPLNAIGMGLQMIRSEMEASGTKNATYETNLNFALDEIERLNTILKNYLGGGKRGVRLEAVDIAEIIHYSVSIVRRFAAGDKTYQACEIKTEGFAEKMTADGNYEMLVQVFYNILMNSVQAVGARRADEGYRGGLVEVRGGEKDGWYEITVADDGGGIPPENIARIFDIGFTTRPAGNGLGLAIAAEAVKQHGGRLSAASGGGRTTVTLMFPKTEK